MVGWTGGKKVWNRLLTVCRKTLSADESAVERFKAKLFALLDKEGIIEDLYSREYELTLTTYQSNIGKVM